jgi:eukaryotic-like serine/threonine-protein kinase
MAAAEPANAASGLAPEPQTPSPGLYRLGDYEVIWRIGQGGMGSVYGCRKAGASGTEKLFTLKVVRQYSSQQEAAEASLAREARLGRLLRHPNIHSVVDSGTHRDQPFIILDYVEGVSLTDLLAGGRRPPAPVVVSIVLDVLRALERVHGASDEHGNPLGLVHCDISPPNILVGADGVSLLTDFGSCRIVAEEGPTRPDPLKLGKPSYMAPEQLCAEPLDSRTDLFALGAVMQGALTGQDIFAAESYADIVLNVLRRRIPPLSEQGGPGELDEFCRRALNRPREGRFASAREMAQALVAATSTEGLLASPKEVAAYLRREHGEELDERRRRIERAVAGGPAPRVSSWELSPAADASPSTAAERKAAPTLFMPAVDDDDLPDTEPVHVAARRRAARDERDQENEENEENEDDEERVPSVLSDVWLVAVKERRLIALSILVGAALLALTVVWTDSGSGARRPRRTVTSDSAPAAPPSSTVQR